MISYVILIAIAISLSIGVYAWLKDYTNVSPKIDCKEDTSMVLEDYNCTGEIIKLTVRNNGRFSVDGFIMQVSNESEKMPTEVLSGVGQITLPGYFDFSSSLEPGGVRGGDAVKFLIGDFSVIKVIQIQPYIIDEKSNRIMCEQAVIKKEGIDDCVFS